MTKEKPERCGAIVLEAIIALPILIIALFAIVEFGLLSSHQSLVHAAGRAGADAAASLRSSLPTDGVVPPEIADAVAKVLAARGITASCIRVEHTNGPDAPYLSVAGTGGGEPVAATPSDDYVCVSVCVENTDLAPNLLELFCLDLDDTYSQHTVCRCLPPCLDDGAVAFEILVEAEGPDATATVGASTGNGWILWSNGRICFNATVPADGIYTFSSRLWSDLGGPDLANAAFVVDGVQVANFDVGETSFATAGTYSTDTFLTAGPHQFCIEFTNDFFMPPIDRNLYIDWMSLSGPN